MTNKRVESEGYDALIVESSPIAFAIVGPVGKHRAILVRSSLPCLDLVGLGRDIDIEIRARDTFSTRLFGPLTDSAVIESKATVPATFLSVAEETAQFSDSRRSRLTFAWRGLVDRGGIEALSDAFTVITPDLVNALKNRAIDDVEWQISPIIAACTALDSKVRGLLYRRRWTFTFVGLIYALFFFFAAAWYLPILRAGR